MEDTTNTLSPNRRTPLLTWGTLFGPSEYTDWVDESLSWKRTCYIGDWSFMPKARFKGPDVLRLFSDLSINSFAKMDLGQAKHVVQCDNLGKVIAEGILSRVCEDEFLCFSWPALWTMFNLFKGGYNVHAEPLEWFLYQVQGPTSLKVLEKVTCQNLRGLKFMHSCKVTIAGHEVMLLRQGMSGELGFEIQGPKDLGQEIYAAVAEAGQEFGLRCLGSRTTMINHLEACFPTVATDYVPAIFGPDLEPYRAHLVSILGHQGLDSFRQVGGSFESDDLRDYYRSPVELGWGKSIKLDHFFVGREALEQELAEPKRNMVTLEWNSLDVQGLFASNFSTEEPQTIPECPREPYVRVSADQVLLDGKLIGVSTSYGYSAFYRRMLSLCTIDAAHSAPGTEVSILWGTTGKAKKLVRARVAKAPYKPDARRMDLSLIS